ncbi:hypothetical protein LTR56_024546 [Elasticomyces elasticus]|nr:hypothetical protein LTR56_024546 [Elasticomyces elasticus]
MAVIESVKEAVSHAVDSVSSSGHAAPSAPARTFPHLVTRTTWGGTDSTALRIEATREEMSAARVPLPYRDSCANLLIPLNKCRYENYYLPWLCQDERHGYEKCQYDEFKLRVKKMDEIRAAKGGERSN